MRFLPFVLCIVSFVSAQSRVTVRVPAGGAASFRLTINRGILNDESASVSVPIRNGMLDTAFPLDQTAVFGLYDGKTIFAGLVGPKEHVAVDWKGPSTPDEKSMAYDAIRQYYYHLLYRVAGQKTVPLDGRVAAAATPDALFDFADSLENAFLERINSLQQDPDKDAYIQLRGLVAAHSLELRHALASRLYRHSIQNTLGNPALPARSRKVIAGLFMFDTTLAFCGDYISRIAAMLSMEHMSYALEMGAGNQPLADKYQWIDSLVPRPLKIPVMTMSLRSDLYHPNRAEDVEDVLERYFTGKEDKVYADYIRRHTGR